MLEVDLNTFVIEEWVDSSSDNTKFAIDMDMSNNDSDEEMGYNIEELNYHFDDSMGDCNVEFGGVDSLVGAFGDDCPLGMMNEKLAPAEVVGMNLEVLNPPRYFIENTHYTSSLVLGVTRRGTMIQELFISVDGFVVEWIKKIMKDVRPNPKKIKTAPGYPSHVSCTYTNRCYKKKMKYVVK